MALASERHGLTGLTIRDDQEIVAEFNGPDLMHLRFRPGGPLLFTSKVPIPLHWRQYANYQDPERNAFQHARLAQVRQDGPGRVQVGCVGTNASHSIESRTAVEVLRLGPPVRYELSVRTELRVTEGARWHVTPNPHHGELEFCTLYPAGAFEPEAAGTKFYQACYLVQPEACWEIPHHHLESADKHNIRVRRGDRFLWLLEDDNPCFELLSAGDAVAGVCAYMWDGHFAYPVCEHGEPIDLPGGARFEAHYRLSSIDREEGLRIVARARARPAPGLKEIPLYVSGMNSFGKTGAEAVQTPEQSWPWEFEQEGAGGIVRGYLDHSMGVDDHHSLRISAHSSARARWIATTIGPAYGQEPFRDHARFALEAMVRSRALSGSASIAIRLHRSGAPALFDPSSYEVYRCAGRLSGDTDWTRLELMTPPIAPAPDRLHILLEQEGQGESWFDNVLLQELP